MLLTSVPVISSFGLLSVSDHSTAGFMAGTAILRKTTGGSGGCEVSVLT